MKRPAQHQIDDLGERIFERKLAPLWTPQKQEDDYGIDYTVRVFAPSAAATRAADFPETEPTGESFAVQLKSTADLQRTGKHIKMRMETDHLAYYADKEALPVFLVVVDVKEEQAYWLFLQEYVDLDLKAGWREQQKVTVEVPQENVLVAGEEVRKAVAEALRYMSSRRPESITQSILVQERLLERQDPRFSVKIEATRTGTSTILEAKQPVVASLAANFTDAERKEAFLQGARVTFMPGEVDLDLPLMQEALQVGGEIQVAIKEPGTATLFPSTLVDPSQVLFLPGEFIRGMGGGRFETGHEAPPLHLTVSFSDDKGGTVSVNGAIELERWCGVPILDLPFFEHIDGVFTSARESGARMQFSLRGKSTRPMSIKTAYAPAVHGLLDLIRHAREIAAHLRINPVLPEDFGPSHAREIDTLHGLLFRGEHAEAGHRLILTVTMTDMDEVCAIAKHMDGHPGELSLSGNVVETFGFLGCEVDLRITDRLFTHFAFTPETLRLVQQLKRKRARRRAEAKLKLIGTDSAQMIVRSTKEVVRVTPPAHP